VSSIRYQNLKWICSLFHRHYVYCDWKQEAKMTNNDNPQLNAARAALDEAEAWYDAQHQGGHPDPDTMAILAAELARALLLLPDTCGDEKLDWQRDVLAGDIMTRRANALFSAGDEAAALQQNRNAVSTLTSALNVSGHGLLLHWLCIAHQQLASCAAIHGEIDEARLSCGTGGAHARAAMQAFPNAQNFSNLAQAFEAMDRKLGGNCPVWISDTGEWPFE
jgi:hypothetical protein